MVTKFDRVCQALAEGWKLNARCLETQDRFTLEAPMPPGCRLVAKWLHLESLEDGTYKCTLRAPSKRTKGEARELQRQKLRRIGPLSATVVVNMIDSVDEERDEEGPLYEQEATTADPVAQETLDKVDQLRAKKKQIEAEIDLAEIEAKAEKFRGGGGVDPAVAALGEQVRTLAAKIDASHSSRQDQVVMQLLQSMMESQSTMQAQMFAAFTKTPASAADPKDMLGSVRELAELLAVLRDDAGGAQPKSEAGELMSMLLELRNRTKPEVVQPAPMQVAPVAPPVAGQAPPAPAAAPPRNGAPPPSPAPELGQQRVGHFLQHVYSELVAQADPAATADRVVESRLYSALPAPFRKRLENGDMGEVLGAIREWAPPEDYARFYDAVANDEAKLAWLTDFLEGFRFEPEPEVPAASVAIIDAALERRTMDPDLELARRQELESTPQESDGSEG